MPFDPAPTASPAAPEPSRQAAPMQRARGRGEVAVSLRGGRTRLDRLYQSGCAKVFLPPPEGAPGAEAVLVNTSGGVAGGDRLDWRLSAGPGASLTATTQAAERIYRSTGADAAIATRLNLGAGATLAWLPQETILFDAARLTRRLDIVMDESATLTALETIVLGRSAMGETVRTGALSDQWRLRRGGRLVHAEALAAGGDLVRATAGSATLAGARALATLVHVEPDAHLRLDAARALLTAATAGAGAAGVEAAATAKPHLLILRFRAGDAHPLRAALIRFLMGFRATALPRVWSS